MKNVIFKSSYNWFKIGILREAVKNYFFPVRGGYPPILLCYFGQNDFPLRWRGGRGGGINNSAKGKIR